MAVTAADVPSKYDLVYTVGANTYGHVFDRTRESTLYGSRARAEYGYTQTFLERTNVSGSYGDEAQAFFLTATQNDWSGGEGQRFFRTGDPVKSRRYLSGQAIDTTTYPGRFAVRPVLSTLTPSGSLQGAACPAGRTIGATSHCYVSHDPTDDLHTVGNTGADTNNGAHGSGTPNQWGMCNDGVNVYIAGSTRITKWTGAAFLSFSATANAGSLTFLNNALYSCDGSTLKTYDGAGTATTLFTWKDATNTALTALGTHPKIVPFGGKLLIFFPFMNEGPELWVYDGVSTSRVAAFPDSMIGYDLHVLDGVAFMSGLLYASVDGTTLGSVPVIYYWANGTYGELWRSSTLVTGVPTVNSVYMPALGDFSGKLIFTNLATQQVMEYDPALGAFTCAVIWTLTGAVGTSTPWVSSGPSSYLAVNDTGASDSGVVLKIGPFSNVRQAGILTSSQIDFENSLSKAFRSIKVEFDGAATLDIWYALDGNTSFTRLQAGAVSGTEYQFPAATVGNTISYQIISQVGGSPFVKRVYLRAAPILQSFKTRTYNLDLTSTPENTTLLNDGSTHPLTGHEQATALISAITSSTPLTIVDRFGSYTGVLEPDKSTVLEIHSDSGGGVPANSGQFIANVFSREV